MTKKRLGVIIVLGLVLIVGLVVTLVLLNGEKWKALAVDTINENVTTEVHISDVEINLFSEFPKISVNLLDVEIEGADNSNSSDTPVLLSAEKLGVAFSLWEVLLGDPVIENFSITGGNLFIQELPGGRWNYEITPESTEDSAPIEVSSIKLYSVDVELKSSLTNLHTIVNKATYSDGSFVAAFEDLVTDNKSLKPLFGTLEAVFASEEDGKVRFDISKAVLNGLPLSAAVNLGTDGDWTVSGRSSNISQENIEAILVNSSLFDGISLGGTASASFKGNSEKIDILFSHPGGTFAVAPSRTGLALNLKGEFITSGALTYYLITGAIGFKLDQIHLATNGITADLTANSKNIDRSSISIGGSASLDLGSNYQSWIPEINSSSHSHLPSSGTVNYRGEFEISPTGEISHSLLNLDIPSCNGTLAGSPYALSNGRAHLSKYGTLIVESLNFDWAGNIGSLESELHKFSSILEGGQIAGNTDIICESVIVDPILKAYDLLSDSTVVSTEASILPYGSSFKYDIRSSNLYWDKLECTDFSSIGTVSHNKVRIAHARTTGINGEAVVDGSLRPGGPGWLLGLNGYADNISLPELFRVYGNFGQEMLRSEHLSGEADVAGSLHLGWSLNGEWMSDAFDANLNVIIDSGKLIGLELFDEVADYLKENRLIAPLVDPEDLRSRLKKIDFENLETTFSVAHSTTRLPFLNIHSSAMDVSIEGTQSFSGDIDYTLGFALRDLRDNKQGEFGNIEDDGLGNMFFLGMRGTLDEPEYYYDRSAHKAHRRKGLSEEAQRLRDAIQENKKEKNEAKEEKEKEKQERPSRRQRKEDSLLNSDDEDF